MVHFPMERNDPRIIPRDYRAEPGAITLGKEEVSKMARRRRR